MGLRCFNPRPVVSHGATSLDNCDRTGYVCFNPRPVVSHGATRSCRRLQSYRHVSIRAPWFPTGRHAAANKNNFHNAFQSAPRGFPRGDRGHGIYHNHKDFLTRFCESCHFERPDRLLSISKNGKLLSERHIHPPRTSTIQAVTSCSRSPLDRQAATLHQQRLGKIDGLACSMVFDTLDRLFIKKVEPQRIFFCVNF